MEQFEPGKTISFRLPQDTPVSVSKYLTRRKNRLGRKFSSEIAPLFVSAISQKISKTSEEDTISVPLPKGITNEQKEWLNHPHTKALISQLLYQVINKPASGFDFDTNVVKNEDIDSQSFKVNNTVKNFAQKTFLNFEDDDDDD
ncbi:hypothetical protein [Bacillus sp. V2I10]|uniref:hypothetical protein n=1 Tax=Bacillus sp. V2I10 TaxID=3042276 RepID=UPI0027885A71|nr:hypothetical protein [Bacillus sp. V2I10]MDQ0862378.1 hypothetical protein [Bacillus sp. V2I10]